MPDLDCWDSWKGYQIRFFFLYLACPLLHSFLSDSDYLVVQNFVKGTLLLSSSSISDDDIINATIAYKHFSVGFGHWGQHFINLNEHNIVHLPEQVTLTGPLWTISGFQSESDLGQVVKSKHTSEHHVVITNSFFFSVGANSSKPDFSIRTNFALRKYKDVILNTNDTTLNALDSEQLRLVRKLKYIEEIDTETDAKILNTRKSYKLSEAQADLLDMPNGAKLNVGSRCMLANKAVIHSGAYKRASTLPSRKDSSIVLYKLEHDLMPGTDTGSMRVGKVQFFVEDDNELYAIVQQYQHPITLNNPSHSQYGASWCVARKPTDIIHKVPVDLIHCRAMLLFSDSKPIMERHNNEDCAMAFVATLVHECSYEQ